MRSGVVVGTTLVLGSILFAANLTVAVVTGSRAVLAEAVYTIADVVGSAVILIGLRASQRPADADHPFGYGKERFFWAFVSTLVIFALGGFLSLAAGVLQVATPGPVVNVSLGFWVVGATLATSVGGVAVAVRELRRSRATFASFMASVHQGVKTVVYQDLVSIGGAVAALAGLAAVDVTGRSEYDGLAAVVVGVFLIVTGVVLSAENRELLVGRAIDPSTARQIYTIAAQQPSVRSIRSLQSMQLGPDQLLVALRVNFQDNLTTDQVESAIDELAPRVRSAVPSLQHLIIEPES